MLYDPNMLKILQEGAPVKRSWVRRKDKSLPHYDPKKQNLYKYCKERYSSPDCPLGEEQILLCNQILYFINTRLAFTTRELSKYAGGEYQSTIEALGYSYYVLTRQNEIVRRQFLKSKETILESIREKLKGVNVNELHKPRK